MKRTGMVLAAAAALALAAAPAVAQKKKAPAKAQFDDVASKAQPVAGLWGLGALLWTQLGSCKKMTNDLDRRQCEGVKQRRLDQISGKSFLFATGAAPLEVAPYNSKKKSAEIELTPCLACEQAIEIGGQKLHVVGQGSVKVAGGAIRVAALHTTAHTFKDQKAYDAWREEVLPRMKTEFVLEVDDARRWSKGGSEGMAVNVVAYRAYDPCTGKVLAGKPASAKMPADQRACGDKQEPKEPVDPEKVVEKPKEPEGPKLPYRLSPFQINAAMAPVRKQQNKCFDAYGVPGRASFKITINNDGKVADVAQTGDFVGTPTGKCVEKAIRAVQFKQFTKASITFDFPVVLQ